ncbi:MAG: hypothetical protein ABH950_03150 [Candidatus Altiarchaeota archaeon]
MKNWKIICILIGIVWGLISIQAIDYFFIQTYPPKGASPGTLPTDRQKEGYFTPLGFILFFPAWASLYLSAVIVKIGDITGLRPAPFMSLRNPPLLLYIILSMLLATLLSLSVRFFSKKIQNKKE